MKTLICGVLLAGILWLTTACGAQPASELIDAVKAYEAAHNAYAIDESLSMFAEDAVFEIVGLGTLETLEAIRAIHEYDKALETQLTFKDCTAAGLTVTCAVTEKNEWAAAAGLADYFYPSSVISFTSDGKIQKIVATMSAEDQEAIAGVLNEFIPWLAANHPDATQKLYAAEGVFIYSESNGVLVVDLLHQWHQEQK